MGKLPHLPETLTATETKTSGTLPTDPSAEAVDHQAQGNLLMTPSKSLTLQMTTAITILLLGCYREIGMNHTTGYLPNGKDPNVPNIFGPRLGIA
jgi:hypothetical protein